MYIDSFFIKRQAAERIDEEAVELFFHVFAYIFTQNLILCFPLQSQLVLNIPIRSKNTCIGRGHPLNCLGDHLILEIKGLDRSGNKVIAADETLLILLVLSIFLSDFSTLQFVGS